jgi:hypothetical protein
LNQLVAAGALEIFANATDYVPIANVKCHVKDAVPTTQKATLTTIHTCHHPPESQFISPLFMTQPTL